jgi:hypothetical protein
MFDGTGASMHALSFNSIRNAQVLEEKTRSPGIGNRESGIGSSPAARAVAVAHASNTRCSNMVSVVADLPAAAGCGATTSVGEVARFHRFPISDFRFPALQA